MGSWISAYKSGQWVYVFKFCRFHASYFLFLLLSFEQERKLCAFPTVEIYTSDAIHYMVPLSRQTHFYVPEIKEEFKTDVKEEDSDEDRGTDITGNKK